MSRSKSAFQSLSSWGGKTGVEFWRLTKAYNWPSEVAVAPGMQKNFENFINDDRFQWKITVNDIHQ